MKTSTLLWRLCMLALAMTLVLPLLPALAEEDAGNAPQNPAVILAANPTTGYTWTVEIADEAVISVADDGIAQGDEQPLTGALSFHHIAVFHCKCNYWISHIIPPEIH